MRTLLALVSAAAIGAAATSPNQLPRPMAACRHDNSADSRDRQRRLAALELAKAINAKEAEAYGQDGSYRPLASLRDIPPVPNGFSLNLLSDRAGYIFVLKDTLDGCRYAIFSDAAGLLYEKSAHSSPVIAH
jgi:hypothetical protein